MAIKVIKTGTFFTRCGNCASELEYEYSDASMDVMSEGANWGGERPVAVWAIRCPVCKQPTKVDFTSYKPETK